MVQGKFKKAKLPATVQQKQKQKNAKAFTRRANAPIQPKRRNSMNNKKLKTLSQRLNKSVENELRSRAVEGQINLSKAQESVAKHHQAQTQATSTQFKI